MSIVPDKIYSSWGFAADVFSVSGPINYYCCKVHMSYSNVVILRMYYSGSKLLTIVWFIITI